MVSTAAYVVLYVVLRPSLPAQGANALALLATAVANTALNRRITFGIRTRRAHLRHQLQGIALFAFGLALTAGALEVLHALAPRAARGVEVAVLIGAGVLATAVRFALFRSWVFLDRTRPTVVPLSPTTPSPNAPSPNALTPMPPSPSPRSPR
jgi:putative flippase GtrA